MEIVVGVLLVKYTITKPFRLLCRETQKLVVKSHWLSICVHFDHLSNREQTYNDEAESIARLRRFLLPVEEWGHPGAAFRAVIL